jgi:hypothetical protein
MFRNLRAEMARYGLDNDDVAELIGKSTKTVDNKLNGRSDWLRKEMLILKKRFPGCTLDYLFGDQDPVIDQDLSVEQNPAVG